MSSPKAKLGEKRAKDTTRREATIYLTKLKEIAAEAHKNGQLSLAADIYAKLYEHGVGKPKERKEVDLVQDINVQIRAVAPMTPKVPPLPPLPKRLTSNDSHLPPHLRRGIPDDAIDVEDILREERGEPPMPKPEPARVKPKPEDVMGELKGDSELTREIWEALHE